MGSPASTVTLAPLAGRSGTRALRLTDAEGVDYWLEYRTATGRDDWLGTADDRHGLQTGVLLRRAGGLPDTSLLLDGTPAAAAGWDGDLQTALPVGTPVPISGGDFSVVVQSVTAAGAVLAVTPTAPVAAAVPAPRPAPTVPDVLPGSTGAAAAAPSAPAPGDAAGSRVTPHEGTRVLAAAAALRPTPALAAAGDSSSGVGLLFALGGVGLLGAAVVVMRVLRRSSARRP